LDHGLRGFHGLKTPLRNFNLRQPEFDSDCHRDQRHEQSPRAQEHPQMAGHDIEMFLDENVADVPALAAEGEGETCRNPEPTKGGFHARKRKSQRIGSTRYILWCPKLFTATPWGFALF
jgi:hypothetical protein